MNYPHDRVELLLLPITAQIKNSYEECLATPFLNTLDGM